MTYENFNKLTSDLLTKAIGMRDSKGKEYANDDVDRLKNFYDIAAETGVSPLVVWQVYVKKHLRAIDYFIKTGGVLSESIEGRFVDVITYMCLGYGLIVDKRPRYITTGADDPAYYKEYKPLLYAKQLCANCIHKYEDHALRGPHSEYVCTKCSCAKYEPT